MKHLFSILIVLTMLAPSMAAKNTRPMFAQFSDIEGLRTTTINQKLLKHLNRGAFSLPEVGSIQSGGLLSNAYEICVINSTNESSRKKLGEKLEKILADSDIESIMETNSDEQKIRIITRSVDNDRVEFITITSSATDLQLVIITNDAKTFNLNQVSINNIHIPEVTGQMGPFF